MIHGSAGRAQDRFGDAGNQPGGESSPGEIPIQGLFMGGTICPFPSQDGTDGHIDQDRTDNDSPDQITGPKIV